MKSMYEMVIGLEVHVELKTQSKLFCGCEVAFGGPVNSRVCPVCMGLPGALPLLNESVVDYALKAGLALHCEITPYGLQDRKQYFYPDSPKAYQISQNQWPIAHKGYLDLSSDKRIGITRIHIEEDAGKLIHSDTLGTEVDYNRCGVPLIEIVSEPDFRSAEEVRLYLQKLKTTLEYLEITTGKMNEGAFRCDVNLSVREKGSSRLGTRTEMKNLNSFVFIVKAIEGEFLRQVALLEAGEEVLQETRRFDPTKGQSFSMRSKEDAHDYRYFPDPDLKPIVLTKEKIRTSEKELGPLPDDFKRQLQTVYGLDEGLSDQLVISKSLVEFFVLVAQKTPHFTRLAQLIISEIAKRTKGLMAIPIDEREMAQLVDLVDAGKIQLSHAKKVLDRLWSSGVKTVDVIEAEKLWTIDDEALLSAMVEEALNDNSKIVRDYRSGKTKALDALVGKVMKQSSGRADPEKTIALFLDALTKFDYH